MAHNNSTYYSKKVIDSLSGEKFNFYVKTLYNTYKSILGTMQKENPTAIGDDKYVVATNPEEILYIARYIYQIQQLSIPGDIMECGCFQGYSSCCLSWAASYFSKKLIIADSFEGLPDVGHKVYKPHEYKGDFTIVKNNIDTYGVLQNVEFIKGWYKDSLAGFSKKLSMLWLDVDLKESTMDVLNNVYTCLDEKGVILSHEYKDNLETSEVYEAIQKFFSDKNIKIKIEKLHNHLGVIYTV
jgi:predicted O-methyltransferase YrrM